LKNRPKKLVSLKKRLTAIIIAVDRFVKGTFSLNRFMKLALKLDRFFFGGIEMQTNS